MNTTQTQQKQRGGGKKWQDEDKLKSEVLHITRTARMTTAGRRFRFRAVVVVGDKQGKVGVGIAQGNDVRQAINKAKKQGEKKMITVPIKNKTIAYGVEAKSCSAHLMLKPQRQGKGLIAGGPVRTICRLAGIENISSKVFSRTKSKMNIANATIKALKQLKPVI